MSATTNHDEGAAARANAAAAIRNADTIAILCHVNPDGDALGSLLGLGLALEAAFPNKRVAMLAQDGVPYIYRFLPGSDRISKSAPDFPLDLAIVVDSGDVKRVGDSLLPVVSAAKTLLDIDHHVGEGEFGAVRLVDSRAAATAELIYDLINELGLTITPGIAACLFTGVITDTGSFRFMNVTPRTLRVAAALIEAGASPSLIAENVFDNRPYAATKLLGLALSTLSSNSDGRICWAVIPRSSFETAEATDQDTEGFINMIRSVRGVEVAMLFREVEVGKVRISLRSTEKVDVSVIANRFGGGGHRMASGCSYTGSLNDAVAALRAASEAALGADPSPRQSEPLPSREGI